MVKLFSSALFPTPHPTPAATPPGAPIMLWTPVIAITNRLWTPRCTNSIAAVRTSVCAYQNHTCSQYVIVERWLSLYGTSPRRRPIRPPLVISSCRVIFNLDHILIIFSDAVRQQAERSKKKLDQKNKFLKMFGQQDNYLKYFLEIICLPWAQFETEINQKFLRSGLIGSEWIKRTNNRGVYNERAWEYGWGEDTQSDSFGTSWLT